MLDVHELRSHYRTLPDERLWELATQEAEDLTPDAIEILKEEIRARGLGGNLEKIADAQSLPIDPSALADLVERFRLSPCPVCGSTEKPLNAFTIATARGYIVWATYTTELVIACPACISVRAQDATNTSLLHGWWAFPWGPISTIRAALANLRADKTCGQSEPSEQLVEFVLANRGQIMLEISSER